VKGVRKPNCGGCTTLWRCHNYMVVVTAL
jgi:hypothetical protein